MFDPENDEQLGGDAEERAGSSVGVRVSQNKDNVNVLPETRNYLVESGVILLITIFFFSLGSLDVFLGYVSGDYESFIFVNCDH